VEVGVEGVGVRVDVAAVVVGQRCPTGCSRGGGSRCWTGGL
jgi:hypothetical protein